MDWGDERWVKLYTRETPAMAMLSWESRALLHELMKRVGRDGALDLGGYGLEGLASLLRMPLDVVTRALPALEAEDMVRAADDGRSLVIVHHAESQRARTSDRERKRRSRAKAAPDASQEVTASHSASQEVTASHTSSRIDRIERIEEIERTPLPPTGGPTAHAHPQDPFASPAECVDADCRAESGAPRPSKPENEQGWPQTSSEPSAGLSWQGVGRLYADRYEQATTRPVALHLHRDAFEAVLLESRGDPEAVKRSLAGFWADEWASANGWPPRAWAKQFGRHLDGPKASKVDDEVARRGKARAERERAERELAQQVAKFGRSADAKG